LNPPRNKTTTQRRKTKETKKWQKTNELNDGKPIGQNIRAMLTGKKLQKIKRKKNKTKDQKNENKTRLILSIGTL